MRSIEGERGRRLVRWASMGRGGEGWLYQQGGVGSGAISAVEYVGETKALQEGCVAVMGVLRPG